MFLPDSTINAILTKRYQNQPRKINLRLYPDRIKPVNYFFEPAPHALIDAVFTEQCPRE